MRTSLPARFTIFGAAGFIGKALAKHLRAAGHEVWTPARDLVIAEGTPAGHVIYAIGLTADFRGRLFDTIEAHVGVLARLMQRVEFDSWLYLSSTRVYGGLEPLMTAREDRPVSIMPSADTTYDLSKLLGEAICLAQPSQCVRAVRLSNVYGPDMGRDAFLGAVIDELANEGSVTFRQAAASAKDYVSIDDVVAALAQISLHGRHRLYNVASGRQTSHDEVASRLRELTGHRVDFAADAPTRIFPPIDISRIRQEFGIVPKRLSDDLASLLPDASATMQQKDS